MEMKQVNAERRMWKYVVFGILTLGIYDIWLLCTMVNDMNRACGYVEETDEDKSMHYLLVWLLSGITLGIYGWVWIYKQGNRIQSAGRKYGVEITEKGSTYLLWNTLGILLFGIGPLIGWYFLIQNTNKIGRAYNARIRGAAQEEDKNPQQEKIENDSEKQRIKAVNELPKKTGVIRCTRGNFKGAEIALKDGEKVLIGRDPSACQVILSDPDISRRHCGVEYSAKEDCYYVTDYSSTGVFINQSQKLTKNAAVRCTAGSRLTFGYGNNEFTLM